MKTPSKPERYALANRKAGPQTVPFRATDAQAAARMPT